MQTTTRPHFLLVQRELKHNRLCTINPITLSTIDWPRYSANDRGCRRLLRYEPALFWRGYRKIHLKFYGNDEILIVPLQDNWIDSMQAQIHTAELLCAFYIRASRRNHLHQIQTAAVPQKIDLPRDPELHRWYKVHAILQHWQTCCSSTDRCIYKLFLTAAKG